MLAEVDYEGLGRRIREYRLNYKLTQAHLAEAVGVSTQFIGNLERGRAIPSLDTFLSLCYALDIAPNDLLQDSLPLCGFSASFPLRLRQQSLFVNTLDRQLLSKAESIESVYSDDNTLIGYLLSDSESDIRGDNIG